MSKMQAVQVPHAGGPLELVERGVPEPAPGQVRVKIEACGVCHSDVFVKEGTWPGITYPRVPGHEVAGTVDAVGEGVGLDDGAAGRGGLVRRELRLLRLVPPRRPCHLPDCAKDHRNLVRRRLCRLHDRTGCGPGGDPR